MPLALISVACRARPRARPGWTADCPRRSHVNGIESDSSSLIVCAPIADTTGGSLTLVTVSRNAEVALSDAVAHRHADRRAGRWRSAGASRRASGRWSNRRGRGAAPCWPPPRDSTTWRSPPGLPAAVCASPTVKAIVAVDVSSGIVRLAIAVIVGAVLTGDRLPQVGDRRRARC